jgi:hypothetical protein
MMPGPIEAIAACGKRIAELEAEMQDTFQHIVSDDFLEWLEGVHELWTQAEAALRYMTIERDSLTEDRDDLLTEKKQSEAALAARNRMLRLFNELEYAARQAVHGDVDESAKGWMRMESVLGELANLRARVEEGS